MTPEPADLVAMISGRGAVVTYRRERDNSCPACGDSNWIVGRSSAECAFCLDAGRSVALPLAEPVNPEHCLTHSHERTE